MKKDKWLKEAVSGFSLTNLLVVFAILAVLAAVLIPITFNLVERARMAADQANARMLYQAAETYVTFNKSTPGSVDQAALSPYIGDDWPSVLSAGFAGRFSCEIEPDGRIKVTTGSAVYDPSSGSLLIVTS